MRAIHSLVAMLAVCCLASAYGAEASEFENSGLYVALDAGVVLQSKPYDDSGMFGFGSTQLTYSYALSMSPGFAVGGRLGYKFRPGWRIEGELAYRRNSYDKFDISAVGTILGVPVDVNGLSVPVEGSNAALLYMVNVYYEFAIADRWLPYAGIGIGGVTTFFDLSENARMLPPDLAPEVAPLLEVGNRSNFGFQVGAGLGFAIDPKTVLSLDYRFLGTVEAPSIRVFGGPTYDYRSHGILLGIRRHF
jgi:opacity protein-like surface antigen